MTPDPNTPGPFPTTRVLQIVAVAALLGLGAVHFYLYGWDDYHFIPTIGPLFVANAVSAAALAVAFAIRPHWILAGAGIGLCLGTLAGYIWTLEGTLFKFHEPGVSGAGEWAIGFEVLGTVALAGWVVLERPVLWRRSAGAVELGIAGSRAREVGRQSS